MTIKSAGRYVREFVDGVRAIPSCSRILSDRANVRSRGFEDGQEFAEASRSHELEAERAAHEEAKLQLAHALETIDALTRWRPQLNEPCPVQDVRIEYSKDTMAVGGVCYARSLQLTDHWRFTAESWAEFRRLRKAGAMSNEKPALKRVGELESAARALVAKMLDVAKPEGMGRAVVYGELWREHRALESLLAKEPGE